MMVWIIFTEQFLKSDRIEKETKRQIIYDVLDQTIDIVDEYFKVSRLLRRVVKRKGRFKTYEDFDNHAIAPLSRVLEHIEKKEFDVIRTFRRAA